MRLALSAAALGAALAKGAHAINVHKSTTDIPTYVSCGNLTPAK